MNYLKRHTELILAGFLVIICFAMYGLNISNYAFIDTDETKFVSIAKEMLNYSDWVNIRLNGENMLNLQPLLFWIINLSCVIFGKISAGAVRLPISCISVLGILILYCTAKSILTKTYAFIIALIMAVSLGTIVFSHLATNDMLSAVLIVITILTDYKIIFAKKSQNTFILRLCEYFFCGLSVLSCGILGFIIPFTVILAMNIFAGKLKQMLLPKNIIAWIFIFTLTAAPWNLLMFYKHGVSFAEDNLSALNIFRTTGIRQMLSVTGLFILGFSPWAFSSLWILGRNFKDTVISVLSYFKNNSQDKLKEKWNKLKKIDKFVSLSTITFFVIFLYALLYGEKNTFIILLLMFPAACISGNYWYSYIVKKDHNKSIFFSIMIPNLIFIACSLAGLFGHNILNQFIFQGIINLVIPLIVIFFVIPVISIFAIILKGRLVTFIANLILMISLSFVITPVTFNFITLNSGENDLIKFAQISNKAGIELASYGIKKYSLVYYYDKKVNFIKEKNTEILKNFLDENPFSYVVVEIKDLWDIEADDIKYMLLDSGKRYCLIQKMPYELEKTLDETEPEVIVY